MAVAREHERREAEAAAALAVQRRHEIEVACARESVSVIQIVLDPAMIAAALAGAERPYRAEVIRGAVER